ncbi:fungal-specific transcription factor domain-containing protein [Amylostereum chailletii]|nr:fungal-specific transcription factor domain-containing protein [Amylostereum chailletii]
MQAFYDTRPALTHSLSASSSGSESNLSTVGDHHSPRMRSHRGNRPSLPQTKHCPLCPAKFTRTTHLNRHLRTHTNERLHRCDTCLSEFTRSDLLTRHKRSCGDLANQNKSRRKSCQACAESKVKCDLKQPCTKCTTRGKECVFINDPKASREKKAAAAARKRAKAAAYEAECSSGRSSPSPPAFSADYSTAPMHHQHPHAHAVHHPHFAYDGNTVLNVSTASDMSPEMDMLDESLAKLMPTDSMMMSAFGEHGAYGLGAPDMHHLNFGGMDFDAQNWLNDNVPTPSFRMMSSYMGAPEDDYTAFSIPIVESAHPLSAYEAPSDIPPPALSESIGAPDDSELDLYMYHFQNTFLSHMPILHMPTWRFSGKPTVLVRAMQACGALFVKTRTSEDFVANTLATTRETLIQEVAKNTKDPQEQMYLILAGLLLQSIGLFDQNIDQRTSSNLYHGMLVMMIHRCGLITKCTSWTPPDLSDADSATVEAAWKDWSLQETIKRTLWLAYLHDTCHTVWFSLPPSFSQNELNWCLPSDDALWRASSSREWLTLLRQPSPYGAVSTRLTGYNMQAALAVLGDMHVTPISLPLSPFAHFVLIHAVLAAVYLSCIDLAPSSSSSFVLQYTLHNWLHSWLHAPDAPEDTGGEAPRFMQNAMPYYWLAQVSLMASQQGATASFFTFAPEARYRVLTRWLFHIRGFLRSGDQAPATLWTELMAMAEEGGESEEGDVAENLVSFFPGDL